MVGIVGIYTDSRCWQHLQVGFTLGGFKTFDAHVLYTTKMSSVRNVCKENSACGMCYQENNKNINEKKI